MKEQSLVINERSFPNGMILDLEGELTKQSESMLLQWRAWEQGMESKTYLVLNFSGVQYINSSGIALLIRLVRAGTRAGFETFAYGLSSHYQKLFKMVGLLEYMSVYPDEYSIMQRIEYNS